MPGAPFAGALHPLCTPSHLDSAIRATATPASCMFPASTTDSSGAHAHACSLQR